MSKNLKNIVIVSASTMGSRILGLLRDQMAFAIFAVSALHSSFLFAFTLPNLFRRLLGEGALTSALIPMFSHELEDKGKEEAFKFFNQVMTWALLALTVLAGLGMLALYAVHYIPGLEDRWYQGAEFGIVLLPYMIFICMAAVLAAVLNVLEKFTLASLSQVWLNLAMIGSLLLSTFLFAENTAQRIYFLCGGVLLGGVLQFIIPVVRLRQLGWKPKMDWKISAPLKELFRILIPGLAGASIFQVNIVVSRLLAFGVSASGVSVLYLTSRLIELPLGVFTIAITTVLFPDISRLVAQKKKNQLGEAYNKGLRMIFSIAIPAMLGLIILRQPILSLLFEWGNFSMDDVLLTEPVLLIAALGLPFYSLATFATRGLHSMKDMKTPFRVAIGAFFINLVMSLILMKPMGVQGLALANVISAAFQGFALHFKLQDKEPAFKGRGLAKPIGQIIMASMSMGVCVELTRKAGTLLLEGEKVASGFAIGIGIPVGLVVYCGILWILRFEEWGDFKLLVKKMAGK